MEKMSIKQKDIQEETVTDECITLLGFLRGQDGKETSKVVFLEYEGRKYAIK